MEIITQKKNLLILICLSIITIFPKWIIGVLYYDLDILSNLVINFIDIQYLPQILSFSEINFSPTYLNFLDGEGVISFPILPLLSHAIFYKFFGPYGLVILNFILKIILFYVIFLFFEKIFKSKISSLIFCILSFFFFSLINYVYFKYEVESFFEIWSIYKNFFGYKIPRPAISSIFLFINLILLLSLKDKIRNKLSYIFLIYLSLSFAMLINTHFYGFVILFPLVLIIIFVEKRSDFLIFLKENFIKVFLFNFLLILFSFPFIVQLIFANPDYSARIGVIKIDIHQKLIFINHYLNKILDLKVIFLILISSIIHFFLKKKIKDYYRLDILFYLIISSIISPLIFVILSPKIINLSHFVSYILFSFFVYFYCSVYLILSMFLNKFKLHSFFEKKMHYGFFLLMFFSLGLIIEENFIKLKKNNNLNDIVKIQKFLKNNKIENSKFKLFTNHLTIQNLWLLNKNTNILTSDAFTNVVSKNQIEYFLINSLKSLGVSLDDFQKYLFEKDIVKRDLLIMFISNYRYQANKLYQYTNLDNYNFSSLQYIKNASPFNNQLTILPDSEKNFLLKKFEAHKIEKEISPDYVIIDKNELNKNLKFRNNLYQKVFSGERFVIFKLSDY